MSKLGKILIDYNYANPRIIIAEKKDCLFAVELSKNPVSNSTKTFKILDGDIIKLNYSGEKLDDCSAMLDHVRLVKNLQLREIGYLTDKCYCNLLRKFVWEQSAMGANKADYLCVRDEVQDQLIKLLTRK